MKKIHISQKDKKLAGVLGGIGETYDIDPTLLRIITLFIFIMTGIFPVLIVYIAAWLIMPEKI